MKSKKKRVAKKSLKPFKSGLIINTVSGTCVNEQDPKRREAYTFEEDDSIVNIDMCMEIPYLIERAVILDLKRWVKTL